MCVCVCLKSQQEMGSDVSRGKAERGQRGAPLSLRWTDFPGWKGSCLPAELGGPGPLGLPPDANGTRPAAAPPPLPSSPLAFLTLRVSESWGALASTPFGLGPSVSRCFCSPLPLPLLSQISESFHSPSLLSLAGPAPCLPAQLQPGLSSPAVSLKLPLHPACSQHPPPPCFQATGSNLSKREPSKDFSIVGRPWF